MSRWRELDTFLPAGGARIFREQQGLDRHRHREGGQADLAEVDIVEIAQADPVEDQKVVFESELVAEHAAEGQGDVAVDHHVKSVAGRDAPLEGGGYSVGEGADASVGGRTGEFEGEDGLGVRRVEVEGFVMLRGSRVGDRVGIGVSGRGRSMGFKEPARLRRGRAPCPGAVTVLVWPVELHGIFRGAEGQWPGIVDAPRSSARRNRPPRLGADHRSEVVTRDRRSRRVSAPLNRRRRRRPSRRCLRCRRSHRAPS